MAETSTRGRRAAETGGRRISPLGVLATVIPLLTAAVLALVRPAEVPDLAQGPAEAPLARSTLVCPAALPGARRVDLASSAGAAGELSTRTRRDEGTVRLADGAGTLLEEQPVALSGEGGLAPGLVATRSGGGAASACTEPRPVQWFTGLAAGAERSSVLSLTNPDRGPAVADVTVLGEDGVLDVPELRGIRVTGGRTITLDLGAVVPTRDALAVGATVTRGRLGVHVTEAEDPVGRGPVRREWLASQSEPAATSYVVGLGARAGRRFLTLANPGDSEVRVEVRLVAEESEFAPAGLEQVAIDPLSVTQVDLTEVLRAPLAKGVRGLRLDATAPVTASLRTVVGGDVSIAVAGPQVTTAGAALPRGSKRLVVAGATAPGVLTWRARDARGRQLAGGRVEVDPGTSVAQPVPPAAVQLDIEVERALVVASVEVGPRGLAVLPLSSLVTTSEVPAVRPALR